MRQVAAVDARDRRRPSARPLPNRAGRGRNGRIGLVSARSLFGEGLEHGEPRGSGASRRRLEPALGPFPERWDLWTQQSSDCREHSRHFGLTSLQIASCLWNPRGKVFKS